MATYNTKLNINDVVEVVDYNDNIAVGFIKAITITANGIDYIIQTGFGYDENDKIIVHDEDLGNGGYTIIKVIGKLSQNG